LCDSVANPGRIVGHTNAAGGEGGALLLREGRRRVCLLLEPCEVWRFHTIFSGDNWEKREPTRHCAVECVAALVGVEGQGAMPMASRAD
jgi:hypothetical protein